MRLLFQEKRPHGGGVGGETEESAEVSAVHSGGTSSVEAKL